MVGQIHFLLHFINKYFYILTKDSLDKWIKYDPKIITWFQSECTSFITFYYNKIFKLNTPLEAAVVRWTISGVLNLWVLKCCPKEIATLADSNPFSEPYAMSVFTPLLTTIFGHGKTQVWMLEVWPQQRTCSIISCNSLFALKAHFF